MSTKGEAKPNQTMLQPYPKLKKKDESFVSNDWRLEAEDAQIELKKVNLDKIGKENLMKLAKLKESFMSYIELRDSKNNIAD